MQLLKGQLLNVLIRSFKGAGEAPSPQLAALSLRSASTQGFTLPRFRAEAGCLSLREELAASS